MSGITQRGTLRWKEWVPLNTQQQRLRNLIQVIAYNMRVDIKREKGVKWSYYYTLHLTTMSAPLYTSEKLESENPKWAEIEVNRENGAACGVIMRLWVHSSSGEDRVISIWGVYFSGLVYLGPRLLCADPSVLGPNTAVFHMQGGYFTASHCFLEPRPPTPRSLTISIPANQVRPSYTVNLLLRLQTMQLAIKRHAANAVNLREMISSGGGRRNGAAGNSRGELRRLLTKHTPPEEQARIAVLKKEVEDVRFKVELLRRVRDRGRASLRTVAQSKDNITDSNMDRDCELMERYCQLRKEMERRKVRESEVTEVRNQLAQVNARLERRRRFLMAELSCIYPINQLSDGRYTVLGVHLPNSEDFEGKDEVMISVALGSVAHLVQMMACFLNVPTRYPIRHFGSRSKIVDHIIDKIPDKDREFPLYSRGKEKLPFEYAVYLLNKNIAQLRWCCGLTTSDLRATLPNLAALMQLNTKMSLNGGMRSERTQSLLEVGGGRSLRSCKEDSRVGGSLEEGLESWERRRGGLGTTQPEEAASDPGRYPPSDLASLMSLDLQHNRYHNGLHNV